MKSHSLSIWQSLIKKKSGFTLIETMIAIALLTSGLVLLTTSWSGSFVRVRKTQLATEVTALLERKIVELEAEYGRKPLASLPEELNDDFGSDYPQYSWKMTSKKLEIPDLSTMMAGNDPNNPPDPNLLMVLKALSEHIKESVKEVKVSVIYKAGKKPLEYSVTQYYVDYDREINVGGAPGVPSGTPGAGAPAGTSPGSPTPGRVGP